MRLFYRRIQIKRGCLPNKTWLLEDEDNAVAEGKPGKIDVYGRAA